MNRLVPWLCVEEWQQVYRWLYSSDKNDQKKGIERIRSWSSRSKVPISVECTSSLREAQHADKNARNVPENYALAIIRFINGVTDVYQRSIYAKPVSNVANSIGLPEWLVDLRMEATHRILPSIETLRRAADVCLQWLRDHYWKIKLDAFRISTEKSDSDFDIRDVLEKYVDAREGKHLDSILRNLLKIDVEVIIEELIEFPRFGSSVEMRDGLLVEKEVLYWKPFLVFCQQKKKRFLQLIIMEMIKRISLGCEQRNGLVAWVICLLESGSSQDVDLCWPILAEWCLEYPSRHAREFVESIRRNLGRRPEIEEWIRKAFEVIDAYVYRGGVGGGGALLHKESSSLSSSSSWKEVSSFARQWEECPIGLFPGQKLSSHMLNSPSTSCDIIDTTGTEAEGENATKNDDRLSDDDLIALESIYDDFCAMNASI